jgi:triphosphoribosyl-dephospho-CoA synthase
VPVTLADVIAAAFSAACRDELDAPKPGNVHVFAPGHRMTATQFTTSADAASGPLCTPRTRVGERILGAVEATLAVVGTNTNLGIILLCAPLASAAELEAPGLRKAVADVLDGLDIDDADRAFAAIVRAAPAGLGRVERHDVLAPADVTLKQAMAAAADRDRVARQYATAFADVFELGLSRYDMWATRWSDPKWATLAVYMAFLATAPDSHVVRKHGAAVAEDVRRTAWEFDAALRSIDDPAHLLPELLAWDAALKEKSINPGTSADLTVATLFARRLQAILPTVRNSG